ncbi:cysteine desulfurase [Actinoplanes sp. OR16]|uniref:aminotransferase class V-fold PLP-dependent enzyme n=1 Tax=Actinoplanes sp. OR16 TaxID=946334 RepID=UPI000F71A4A6|nr:aminotransferase class V-fold PLP-dependent enzyme [Actinoplanes sp. OR16]BBH67357.1 cysteine desulfurase [Actinoplanes sp. OR16]
MDLNDWHRSLRAQFPQIAGNPDLAYLDNAATSQKPQAVLDAVFSYLTTGNANAARGSYPWANRTTSRIEEARHRLRRFFSDISEISGVHFVSGTTEGLRAVARDWLLPQLKPGDEILVPHADHSANLLPWEEAAALSGAVVRSLPYDSAHDYAFRDLAISPRTRLIAATHVHHVYGNDMNVHRLRTLAPDVPICLDAAQSFGHLPLSVADLDVDFVVFSGHKAMALPGIGAVWARNQRGPEFRLGGWAGSPNTAGIVSLVAAMDWLDEAGLDRIESWNRALGLRLTDGLSKLPDYEVLGCQQSLTIDSPVQQRHGIVAFRHHAISSNDLGFILSSHGLLVRSDAHCQAVAGEKTSSVRVSVHAYNSPEEIDRLLEVLSGMS